MSDIVYDIRVSEDERRLVLAYEGRDYYVDIGWDTGVHFPSNAWCRLVGLEVKLYIEYPHIDAVEYCRIQTEEERLAFDEAHKATILQVVARRIVRFVDEIKREYGGRQNI